MRECDPRLWLHSTVTAACNRLSSALLDAQALRSSPKGAAVHFFAIFHLTTDAHHCLLL